MKIETSKKVGENMGMENIALLNNRDGFTVFQFGKHTIRFRAPYSLERYTEIREWDNGTVKPERGDTLRPGAASAD